MIGFVYIIDRDGELDVYASLDDAQEASEILGVAINEQVVFPESIRNKVTRAWLDDLKDEKVR